MSEHTKDIECRVVALEGQVDALLVALAPVPEAIASCIVLCNKAASISQAAVVTREVQIVDVQGRVVIRLAVTDDGGPSVQIVRRDSDGEIAAVDEGLFEQP